ncbi:U11/U12 small nuclear ribonucleoprotein 59 kDa protein isoform X4 [Prosopis cineraria]|uniref:U11/U12 small nuclear ribonucleoprotein 59 kDa protein isoform X4 n=1 Tax=Prosopis cineraria TaxID=364024 RepID=UPI0024100716|nr:U11/U12 small nuclear ribonucleoprotein 59 kDa protein isoform X4 [Prosopis cineraria]
MFPLFPLRLLISLNLALTMNPFSSQFAQPPRPPPPWFPLLPPDPPNSSAFWNNRNVRNQLSELQDTLNIAKAMQKELEMLMMIKEGKGSAEDAKDGSAEASVSEFQKYLEDRRVSLETQESLAVEAANSLMLKLRAQLEPFRYIADETSPWEEKSAPARLENKLRKSKRNKIWRKRKRKRIAEMLAKEREQFDQIDQEANEWMAKEIAKDIANKKVERMKEIAKLKAKEEKKKLESELELLLIVEKLQELRSIRIQKMKRQGYFLPEEDNKFLERVQAAVEEEERQALAAADTDAAREAIVSAEESRKSIQNQGDILKGPSIDDNDLQESKEQKTTGADEKGFVAVDEKESSKKGSDGHGSRGAYDGVTNLPIEFYHYYHGSNSDMGTLIEVRRGWDAYIRPGGSRIPGHWVQPPPPADEIWASYLVKPN